MVNGNRYGLRLTIRQRSLKVNHALHIMPRRSLRDNGTTDYIRPNVFLPVIRIFVGSSGVNDHFGTEVLKHLLDEACIGNAPLDNGESLNIRDNLSFTRGKIVDNGNRVA